MNLLAPFTALHDLLALGGPVVMLLAAMSVLSLAVILTKLAQFAREGVGRHTGLETAISLWDNGQRSQAIVAAGTANTHLGPVLSKSMMTFAQTQGGMALRARVEGEMAERLDLLERGFWLLDSIAQTAPLLGLFGTVLGMIDAFQALQLAGASVDPSVLAGGIWVALLTTAAGLGVAMPTALALTWLETRAGADRAMADTMIRRLFCPVSDDETSSDLIRAAGKSHGFSGLV